MPPRGAYRWARTASLSQRVALGWVDHRNEIAPLALPGAVDQDPCDGAADGRGQRRLHLHGVKERATTRSSFGGVPGLRATYVRSAAKESEPAEHLGRVC